MGQPPLLRGLFVGVLPAPVRSGQYIQTSLKRLVPEHTPEDLEVFESGGLFATLASPDEMRTGEGANPPHSTVTLLAKLRG